VFVAAQDPYTVYYVNKFKMPKPGGAMADMDAAVDKFLTTVLVPLSAREVTGNDAKTLVESAFASMNAAMQKWCQRILLKNLRVGVQESTVNKVWPNLVKSFAVALAQTLKSEFTRGEGIKILDKVTYPVRVEPKLDGLRCIAVKKDGEVTFFTRNGTRLETLPRIQKVLEDAKYDNVVLDGEAMGDDWNESASVLMSRKDKKDDGNIFYNVFDAMPLADWVAQESTMTYADRCKLALETVLATVEFEGKACVRLVPHITAQNEDQLKTFFAKCMNEGYEGVMLKRMDTAYEWDRSKNILKLKPCVTYEGIVVGSYEGRRGTKREGQFGGFYVLLPNKVITRCGGGFNDALRAQIQLETPASWNGTIVECEAQPDPLTKDGLTVDGKMRFPVYCRNRDASDVDKAVTGVRTWWGDLSAEEQQKRIDEVSRTAAAKEE
jgi:ATP-dependent DNA ligase